MKRWNIGKVTRALLVISALGAAVEMAAPSVAEARVGRGRSVGRSARPATPPPSQQRSYYNNNNDQRAMPQQPQATPNRGVFMRGLAGGLAGGFLGSMLFSSFAHGAGAGAGGGGIGLFEIILIAGLGYLGLRWWKSRQTPALAQSEASTPYAATPMAGTSTFENVPRFRALEPVGIDQDAASDLFFRVQGAWTRRDLSPVAGLLSSDVMTTLGQDIDDLKKRNEINRLENITLRGASVLQSWEEDGQEFSTVRFTANLLDYTVNEKTGEVSAGSDHTPVKFEEDWTFAKAAQADAWQLVGIQQV